MTNSNVFLIISLFISLLSIPLSASGLMNDNGDNKEEKINYYDVVKFYESNPLDAFHITKYKKNVILYKYQNSIPVSINPEVLNLNDHIYIFMQMADGNVVKSEWTNLYSILTANENNSDKDSNSMIYLGSLRKNLKMNNRLEFYYVDNLSRATLSLPIESTHFTLKENSNVLIEGRIINNKISPGNLSPRTISIINIKEL